MGYDITVIRPRMQAEDVKLRREGVSAERLKAIRKGLHTFHTLETMAVNIYKFQITRKPSEHNRQLIAAMCNEMTHLQDFQVRIYEYGFRPSILRFAYLIVGFVFGFGSRMLGRRAILKTGIWVESKAVEDYAKLLRDIDWDSDSRKVIEKNQADENGHINQWKAFLQSRI